MPAISNQAQTVWTQANQQLRQHLMIHYGDLINTTPWPTTVIGEGKLCQYYDKQVTIGVTHLDGCQSALLDKLKHEHIHWLVNTVLNFHPITAFNEGIAVALADWPNRSLKIGFNQHHLCRQLLIQNALIPMEKLIEGVAYFGFRHDFRVDVQFGSFCGYYIDKLGFYDWCKTCAALSQTITQQETLNLLQNWFNEWQAMLTNQVADNLNCQTFVEQLSYLMKSHLANCIALTVYSPCNKQPTDAISAKPSSIGKTYPRLSQSKAPRVIQPNICIADKNWNKINEATNSHKVINHFHNRILNPIAASNMMNLTSQLLRFRLQAA
ncbi:hypothetical protein [Motilimonas sp. KMU-193]|uniref:hypothetical protein n=1 Tax=Motilimonas sp. KMU-193 TaxID=3388668 RepID=UPI00396AFACC